MEKESKDIWESILANQKLDLVSENGVSDCISFNSHVFNQWDEFDGEDRHNPLFTIYFDHLGMAIDPSLLRKKKFEEHLKITDCTENYKKTFLRYFQTQRSSAYSGMLGVLGEWGNSLVKSGRLIIEIVGWYTNDSNQLYAFELKELPPIYCKIGKEHIVYRGPEPGRENGEIVWKEVKIPVNKCIIIEFPEELGGFENYTNIVHKVLKLGNQFSQEEDPGKRLAHAKAWDKKYDKIISQFGTPAEGGDTLSEFYKVCLYFRYKRTVMYCTHSLINGLSSLIKFLNINFRESAKIEFHLKPYDIQHFNEVEKKWLNNELSFKEAYDFLKF